LRCRRSFAALGGGETGRGLILGGVRAAGVDVAPLFTGDGHAPLPLMAAETARAPDGDEGLDLPGWLLPRLRRDLGADLPAIAEALRHRAPVFLRTNLARADRATAQVRLAAEEIETRPHPLSPSALEVVAGARRIQSCATYAEGVVELQDAASQAVVDMLPLSNGMKVLDFCAGGGGKTLAMAARARLMLFAHDADRRRMRDLPARAKRAGVRVTLVDNPDQAFDLVLADVPCSGSGSWRRAPEGKWLLTEARLAELIVIQAAILDRVALRVRPGGWLGYVTCSLLSGENRDQVDAFLARHSGWRLEAERRLTPLDGGDGFYAAVLRR
jgi:16S rRNA (cytosine967-C5)-methyltransferase